MIASFLRDVEGNAPTLNNQILDSINLQIKIAENYC